MSQPAKSAPTAHAAAGQPVRRSKLASGPQSGGPGGGRPKFARPEKPLETFWRLAHYMKGHYYMLILGLLFAGLSSAGSVAANYLLKPILNALVYGGSMAKALPLVVGMAVIFLFSGLFQYVSSNLMVHLSQNTVHNLRRHLFDKLEDMPIQFFDTHNHGDLMSSFTNDVDNISQALDQSLVQIFTGAVSFIGTFAMMLYLSPLLTLTVVAMLAVMLLLVKVITSRSARYFRAQQAELADLNGYIEEMTEGQKVVKVFNHEDEARRDFESKNEALRQASTNAQTFAVILMPIMGNLSYVQYGVTAVLGAILAINGRMDIGTIGAYLQYTRSFSQPITQISNQFNMLIAALAGAERVFKIMDQPLEQDDGDVSRVDYQQLTAAERQQLQEAGWTPEQHNGKTPAFWRVPAQAGQPAAIRPIYGDIRFCDVSFGYVPGQTVLKQINLYAKPGQKIAFVGSTGAGKTTITNLLNRFYDIREGEVLFDGIDIRRIRKADLRQLLGMVLQDVHLFRGSIADNIRYGKLDATDEEIRQAAQIANADTFIRHLPEGYNTLLTADGSNLSQGQRQLVSIARAAVADPLILILDEATSSIDTRTEHLIELGMNRLMEGRTVFAIAHRLSTVRHSDAILVLEHGEIIERGEHDSLMAQKGRYYELNVGKAELD